MTRDLTWAATSMPEIRRRVRNAFADLIRNHSTALRDDPADQAIYTQVQLRKRESMAAKLADSIEQMRHELHALDRAELFWVSRDMVPTVIHAAATLPAWTPELALPAEAGLLCWARPAGDVPFAGAGEVPWDAGCSIARLLLWLDDAKRRWEWG